jgi:large subunit ribosomal protein L28
VMSDALGEMVKMRISVNAIRTIEFKGGLDSFLLGTPNRKLTDEARRIKRRIEKAAARA